MQKRLLTLVLLGIVLCISGCGKVDHGLTAVDNAINELKQSNKTFDDLKNILSGTKEKLDKGDYQRQIDELISRTSQVAQLGVEGSVDFTRTRLKEDLENIKRSLLGQSPAPRVPILSNPQSVSIDFSSTSRSTVTIVGWNLDVAEKAPEKYIVTIRNEKEPDRTVDKNYVPFQGQYAVTLNVSTSGIPFKHFDKKVVFSGFDPVFELAVINSDPPPPAEKIVSISGNIKTTNQNREGGFCIIELRDGETVSWSHKFPEKPEWGDGHPEPFAWDKLSIPLPSSPRFLVVLTQDGAEERNILWRFQANAEFRTDRGNTIRFDQTGLELHCGDGRPATVSTPVNLIR